MIIAVGFKVNSERAVKFRKWVNQIAKDYTIKGWVMDDERLKRGTYLTEKYFDEQLERMPLNFRLEYIDENGEKQRPIMIHRVCFGSLERFIGILTEQFQISKMPEDALDVHAGAFEIATMREIYTGAIRENALIPNGYVGEPKGSQYIETKANVEK